MKKLLVVLLLLYPMSALAQTYEWTDEKGTVNFTEDLGNVPKKYRKKVKLLDSGESAAPQSTVMPEPVKGRVKGDETRREKKLYGGRDESSWRNEFLTVTGDLGKIEAELADLRARMGDTSKMSRSEYVMLQNSIKNDESRLQQQRKRLDQLRDSADRFGVPTELRQ